MSKRKPAEDKRPPEDVQLSKALSKMLRHDAIKMDVAISQEGWVLVSDALKYLNERRPRQPWSEEDVVRVVNLNDKQRFALRKRNDGCSELRANQGHSMPSISVDMVRLSSATAPPMALHGTYHRAWPLIRMGGLSKMNRQHVHMARALPGASGVPAWSNAALGRVLLPTPHVLVATLSAARHSLEERSSPWAPTAASKSRRPLCELRCDLGHASVVRHRRECRRGGGNQGRDGARLAKGRAGAGAGAEREWEWEREGGWGW